MGTQFSPRLYFALAIFATAASHTSSHAAVPLPYEVENSIIDMTDPSDYVQGLDKVNIFDANTTRSIYRKDLDSSYIAYYEIEVEGKYILLSAGPGTGDYREAESGPSPRPTDTLIQQAREHGQECSKFFRLDPFGLSICENEEGRSVAATFNWTSDVTEVSNWRQLDDMVSRDLKYIAKTWRKWAVEVEKTSEWKTTEVLINNRISTATEEQAVAVGSVVKLALEEDFKKVMIYARDVGNKRLSKISFDKWQRRLCQVLVNVCSGNGTFVHKDLIKRTNNGLPYLQLEVNNNREVVQNILKNKELGFVIVITSQKGETVLKHYVIELASSRKRRSSGYSSWVYWSIPLESRFPDYNQHVCCGCISGCTPVAWAQIFGYYDRIAPRFGHSKGLFRCVFGPRRTHPGCEAPDSLDSAVESFVEGIRTELGTYCSDGAGATSYGNLGHISSWYKARQGYRARVENVTSRIGKRSSSRKGSTTVWGSEGSIRDKAIAALKGSPAYPAQVSIDVAFKSNGADKDGHSAVVTKYRERYKRYRSRHCRKVGWWWGRKTKCEYKWSTQYDRQFYYHMGWGGSRNAWHKALANTVSIAKPY